MKKTTRQAILDQQALNRKIYNKENITTEDIQQERIDVLNETIDIMNRIIKTNEERINILKHAIEIDKQTIKIQSETINNYLNSKSNV
tara:strand:- start:149 stop:412 length:264 start_codon:yes stop_codon:yes gene_type:complete